MRRAYLLAAIVTASACSSSEVTNPTTTTPTGNHNPVISSVTVTPAFGVSGLTAFSMSASATDVDNDALNYQWLIGGTTVSGATVAGTLLGDGDISIRLTVTDGRGGAVTDARSVMIGTMTGRWSFLWNNNACGALVAPIMTMTQFTGGLVTGTMESPGTWCNVPAGTPGRLDPAAPASIDGLGNFTGGRLKFTGYLDVFLTGKLDSTGRTITGTARSTSGQINAFTLSKL
jgi:hypothetical protein